MAHVSVGSLIDLFAILGALFALWKGERAERAAAIIVIVNVAIGEASKFVAPESDIIRLINDGVTALVLLGVTVRYAALWMGGVMLFFAAQFSMHAFYLVMERSIDYYYALINNIDFSGIIWCLIIGTAVAWRARLRRVRAEASPGT